MRRGAQLEYFRWRRDGFTGSRVRPSSGGRRPGPKPIYLEMSSGTPVFVLSGRAGGAARAIADELFASCSLGTGQFCTKPGLTVVLASERSEAFLKAIAARFQAPPGVLLGSSGLWTIGDAVRQLREAGAELIVGGEEVEGAGFRYANTLLRVSGERFLAQPEALQTEAFGVVSLTVFARDVAEMEAVALRLEGNLTASFYTDAGRR